MVTEVLERLRQTGFWLPFTLTGSPIHMRHPDGGSVLPVIEQPWAAAGLLLHMARDPRVTPLIGLARWDGQALNDVVVDAARAGRGLVVAHDVDRNLLVDADDPVLTELYGRWGDTADHDSEISVWFDTVGLEWRMPSEAVPAAS